MRNSLNYLPNKYGRACTDICSVLFFSYPAGRPRRLKEKMMRRVNSEVRRSQQPPKKGLTKAEAERRIAHGAVLQVGAAGQRLFSLNTSRYFQIAICLSPVFPTLIIFFYIIKAVKCIHPSQILHGQPLVSQRLLPALNFFSPPGPAPAPAAAQAPAQVLPVAPAPLPPATQARPAPVPPLLHPPPPHRAPAASATTTDGAHAPSME